jgi:hypothetical protein
MSTHPLAVTVQERSDGVRLHLGSVAYGDGPSLQEAADDLVLRVLALGRALRTSGFAVSAEFPCDVAALNLLAEVDEIAAAGGDVRTRLFGA